MSTSSEIEWTQATWNPVVGCAMVSPGCARCYAETMSKRLAAMAQTDIDAGRDPGRKRNYLNVMNDKGRWAGNVVTVPDALMDPFRWKRPRKVFVNSMSDLFHEDVPFDFADRVFAVMALTRRHTYQILTKRTERMAEYVLRTGRSIEFLEKAARELGYTLKFEGIGLTPWPLPNVWLGTSVEDQQRADERIPHLLKCAAAVRFLSCEPLLGAVDLSEVAGDNACTWNVLAGRNTWNGRAVPRISWVIAGGESGPASRPCNVEWIRSIVTQCKAANTPCFVKQLGASVRMRFDDWNENFMPLTDKHDIVLDTENREWGTWRGQDRKGGDPEEWPEDLRVREFPQLVKA